MAFQDRIIVGFKLSFKSIAKDDSRYFDALFDLIEKEDIKQSEYIEYSSAGSLWIVQQYIEQGYLEMVEKDLRRDVASRDFHGPLFENTRKILDMLLERDEIDIVLRTYKAAITHRLKAITEEQKLRDKSQASTQAHKQSAKWVKHYYPALRDMILEYSALVQALNIPDSEQEIFQEKFSKVVQ